MPRPRKRGQQPKLPVFTQDDITQNRQINEVRGNVDIWRKAGWPDVSPITRQLLEHRPYEDRRKVRVAGRFTVEPLPAPVDDLRDQPGAAGHRGR